MVTASTQVTVDASAVSRHERATPAIHVGELTGRALTAAFRLRHEVVCRRLGELPLRENGLESDAWDEHALHLHASVDGRLLAYVRLIFPGSGPLLMETLGYPTDQLPPALQGRVVEVSRMIIDPDAPIALRNEVDLLGRVMELAQTLTMARGDYGAWVFDIDTALERSLKKRAWPLVPFSPAVLHHRIERRAFYVPFAALQPHQFRRPALLNRAAAQ